MKMDEYGNVMDLFSEEELKQIICDTFKHFLSTDEAYDLYNDYAEANKYERIYWNNNSELESFCNDSLSEYFDQMNNTDHYDKTDDFFMVGGNGWIKSLDSLDVEVLLTDNNALQWFYDNYGDYEDYFADAIEDALADR